LCGRFISDNGFQQNRLWYCLRVLTIAVSVKVGEGLVLAAESTSSSSSEGNLAQSYHHARKLLQEEKYPIGILTYGLGSIGGRNLESVIAEFERTLPPHDTGDS
jgi:hypothetical protein